MKTNSNKAACALLALAASLGIAVAAQTTPTTGTTAPSAAQPAPPLSLTEQWIKDVKNPAPWLTWGADLRFRNEYFNNSLTLNEGTARHEQDYFRFRGRIWASVTPWKDFTLNARLSAEPRNFMKPGFPGTYAGQTGMEWRYGIFDNLNFQWRNMFDQPLTLTVGRQDILMGDFYNWFMFADGTPGDGSWSFFLDAARLTLDLKDAKTKFDFMYIYQNAQPDAWIPTLGRSKGYALTEQNEQGAVVYVSNKSIKNTQLDGYFIYKRDNAEFNRGDNANLYTFGAKVTGDVSDHWRYSVEGAYQLGNKQSVINPALTPGQDQNVGAWGLNSKLMYNVKDSMKNQFRFSLECLSGDDAATTGKNEGFDLLWGRWPRWSELYIYSYIPENGRVAQINNLIRFGPGWSISPTKKLDFSVDYMPLFSDQPFSNGSGVSLPAPGAAGFGTGNFRGHYVQAILKYKFNQHVSAHLWGEFVWMGDFYKQRDLMSFLRAEVLFTF